MNNVQVNTVGKINRILKDIYVIKNDLNEKLYIGQALDSESRFISHCKSSAQDCLIDKVINEFGKEHFWYEIIEHQVENYDQREEYWISELNTKFPNGYNIAKGGSSPPMYRGLGHPSSTLTEEQVKNIKNNLKNTNMSLSEIGEKNGSNKRTVLRINQGISYEEIGEEYPIRKIPNMNGVLTEQDVDEIIDILKYSYRQYDEIGKQYGVKGSTIKEINAGTNHFRESENYPIRKYKNSGLPNLTYEQVTQLSDDLLYTEISCNKLAKKYNVPLNTIYLVNNGTSKRYHRDQYIYPLRKHNPKQ